MTDVMLPSPLERKQLFHALKRWSSYTAWRRILGFYQAWADVAERSLREASASGLEDKTSIPESSYVSILRGLASCDDGVRRLRSGDKRVFRCDSNGDFAMARRGALDHWAHKQIYIDSGDIAPDVAHTPRWREFMAALADLETAWSECSPPVIEPNDMGVPTQVATLPYGVWMQKELARMTFPDPLPDVAEPPETVLVRTGRAVPCSGIWEPVDVAERPLFRLFAPKAPEGPFVVAGGMNYLHQGAVAPKVAFETATDNLDLAGFWQLVWRDDRYASGGDVPEEERSYVFLYPKRGVEAV